MKKPSSESEISGLKMAMSFNRIFLFILVIPPQRMSFPRKR